jgi:FkbM family methyltransferase
MDLIRTFLNTVTTYETILDIGANVGGYTHLFRGNCPDATIHAFEPIPSIFAELQARYATESGIYVWNVGVGAKDEVVSGVAVHEAWTINRPGETRRGRNATHGASTFDMAVTTVDTFLSDRHYEFDRVRAIKIDTDGYDFRVLQGAKQTIARCRPRILIEFGYLIADLDGTSAIFNMLSWIDGMGYDIYDERGEQREGATAVTWYPYRTTADFLLVPRDQPLNPVA